MLKIIFAWLLLTVSMPLFSQKYTTAAGVRIGGGIGIQCSRYCGIITRRRCNGKKALPVAVPPLLP